MRPLNIQANGGIGNAVNAALMAQSLDVPIKWNAPVVITCVRNGHAWFAECMQSCRNEVFTDVRVYDDASSPPIHTTLATVTRSDTRLGAYHGRALLLDALANDRTQPDSRVVVLMDGDDTFKRGRSAAALVRETYGNPGVQMASFSAGGRHALAPTYADMWEAFTPYMRTFRLGLYRQIRALDPTHEFGRMDDGSFVMEGSDRCLINPMVLAIPPNAYRCVDADLYNYRVYRGMTHHDPANKNNRDRLVRLLKEKFPHRARR